MISDHMSSNVQITNLSALFKVVDNTEPTPKFNIGELLRNVTKKNREGKSSLHHDTSLICG